MSDACQVIPEVSACELYKACREENERRWTVQEQRNVQSDALLRRWGIQLDQIKDGMAECKINIAKGQDHSQQIANALERMQQESREYMDGTTSVLKELAESMRSWREASEHNHASLMSAVASNAAVAARAVDRADAAAGRADEARKASGESAGRLSAMTRATLAGWIAATAAAATLGWHLVTDYGWPWFRAWLHRL